VSSAFGSAYFARRTLNVALQSFGGLRALRAAQLWQRTKPIPVLVATSSDSTADRSGVADLGAPYFQKPIIYDEFIRVGSVLGGFLNAHGLL
jgi:DNA-binding response OmpR family regulator